MQTMYAEKKPIDMVTVADALVARYGEGVQITYRQRDMDGVVIDFVRQ